MTGYYVALVSLPLWAAACAWLCAATFERVVRAAR